MSQWLNIDGFLYRMEEYSRCLSTLFETIISSPSPDTQWYIPIKCFRNLWLGLPLTNTPVYWVFFLLTWWETDYTHCFSFNFRQGQESLRWIWHNWQLIMKNIHIQSLYFFFHSFGFSCTRPEWCIYSPLSQMTDMLTTRRVERFDELLTSDTISNKQVKCYPMAWWFSFATVSPSDKKVLILLAIMLVVLTQSEGLIWS